MFQICTELLYQPLTLLDCLHTFCGSCLKEWFHVQGSRRRPSRPGPKFTCPSCRAAVRETRPNATVTTLLDIILAANPGRAKSQQEKEEIAQRYKPGNSVFPQDESTDDSEEDDQMVVQEVRQLSLQDSQSRTRDTRHRTPQSRTRRSDRPDRPDHDTQREDGRSDGRSRRRRDDDRSTRRRGHHDRGSRRTEEAVEQTRRIEHQSSLRSLLSLSDAETMEEEILRQIVEEGLLDNIDMDNLGPRQEEELSERIAEAYRRRHRLRSSSGQQRSSSGQLPEVREPSESTPNRPRARSHSAQGSATRPPRESSRPPASRPHLLDPLVPRPGPSTTQRRRSSEGANRRRESPGTVHPATSSETTLRSTARSSSDSTDRPRASQTAPRASESSHTRRRRATESDQTVPHLWTPGSRERGPHHVTGRPMADSPTSISSPLSTSQSAIPPISSSLVSNINGSSNPNGRSGGPSSRPSSSRSNATHAPSFVEPSISCSRCGKADIQYELHKDCLQCNDGNYHLCLRCYRVGRGCLQWPGFAASAQANYGRIVASSNNEPVRAQTPHVLLSSKYKRPSGNARRLANDDRQMTNDDPARRLQTGFFCDICKSPANDSFWKCDQCNEGDWGFCNWCVNQGRCCTHPLLPICRLPSSTVTDTSQVAATASDANNPSDSETFKILSFSTNCDICTQPISTSTTRFHCLVCNDGDYDVCSNCYLKLGATGKISKENGHNGWRRCAKGHRMIIVGYEDHDDGPRRVVVRDLVGGRALKDEHVYRPSPASAISSSGSNSENNTNTLMSPEVGTGDWSWKEGSERRKKASRFRPMPNALSTTTTNPNGSSNPRTASTADSVPSPTTPTQSNPGTPTAATRRFPPDGGVGAIVYALWAWYPEDGVEDELTFPRGAEITEGENINDDWFWGCYAGSTGLFPGTHVRVLDEVS